MIIYFLCLPCFWIQSTKTTAQTLEPIHPNTNPSSTMIKRLRNKVISTHSDGSVISTGTATSTSAGIDNNKSNVKPRRSNNEFVAYSMKYMDPQDVIAMLEMFGSTDPDRAVECFRFLKQSSAKETQTRL
jgi:hypothetical protein